jgi:hypothetical protein
MTDDVALHLGRACFDGVSATAKISVGPNPFVDGERIVSEKLPVGTKKFLGNLLEPLIKLAPEDFLDGALRAGDAGGGNAAG